MKPMAIHTVSRQRQTKTRSCS